MESCLYLYVAGDKRRSSATSSAGLRHGLLSERGSDVLPVDNTEGILRDSDE